MATQSEILAFTETAKYNIKCLLNEAVNLCLYEKVKLKRGKYRGRLAQITSIIVDNNAGLLYLCMVYKKNSNDFLNSDGDSRSYVPLSHFELIGERDVI